MEQSKIIDTTKTYHGAMVGKMPNVIWLEGSFMETIKGWESAWFYITEPRDTKWVAAPKFRSGFPTRLTS